MGFTHVQYGAVVIAFWLGLLGVAGAADEATVHIRMEKDYWRVTASGNPVIEAKVALDGALVDLRFLKPDEVYNSVPNPHRPSFIKIGTGLPDEQALGGSRGVFFLDDQPLLLSDVKPSGDSGILAESDQASLLYEFHPGGMQWTATNKTNRPLALLMVIDPTACVVKAPGRDPVRAPAIKWWPDTTWYQDGSSAWWKVMISGGDRLWGPGAIVGKYWKDGLFQVWEATLAPGEKRQIKFQVSRASDDDVSIARELVPEPVPNRRPPPFAFTTPKLAEEGAITLYSPVEYRVFQRQTRTLGRVLIAGKVASAVDKVEVRLVGKSLLGPLPDRWEQLPVDPVTHGFRRELEVPAGGWYRLEMKENGNQKQVEHVGVGEVFVTCGQSNSTNYGAGSTPPNRTQTGLVSSFSGEDWRLCQDPQPGTTDDSQGGSPWPYFGDAMAAKYGVPVAVAVTGQGGAPVQHWRPGKFPFFWVMMRINQLGPGGFRALLWHQGESNVNGTTDFYHDELATIIRASHTAAGWDFPWFVAQVSYHNPQEATFDSTRNAQEQLWKEGLALRGPDTDTLVGPDRGGIHLSVSGLKKHGEMWASSVGEYLDTILTPQPPTAD